MKSFIFILSVAFMLYSCNSGKIPKDAKIVELRSKQKQDKQLLQFANFTLQLNNDWEKEPPSNAMRVAQFKLKAYPNYQLVVSYFGNTNNNISENVERWKKQFSQVENYYELKPNMKAITAVKIQGTYKNQPFPMSQEFVDEPAYGMLAAIIPSNEGPYFLKFTAPDSIIEKQERNFVEALNSYTTK